MRLFVLILISFLALQSHLVNATKLSGTIKNDEGEPLAYATIYIKELGTGTVSNDKGYYEIDLEPGEYHVVYRYLSLQSVERTIDIGDEPVTIDIQLPTRVVMLKDVVVSAGEEDPAYTIMRKSIAKASYHAQQVEEFTAKVYMKGNGKLRKVPFYLRGRLKKEGIETGKTYVSETRSKIRYKRPDKFEEEVISVRKTGPERQTPPMEFISGSFYNPKVADVISPLSPKAFAYYRFEYMGTFKDQGYDISKIKVIPRTENEHVVSGYLKIVEEYWSIHSLEFNNVNMGVSVDLEQIFEPVHDKAWLPVTQKFFIKGKFWGFKFEYDYLATISDYDITLNPDLPSEVKVVDEQVEDSLEEKYEDLNKSKEAEKIQDKLTEGEQVSTKELKNVLKSYEKAERKKKDTPSVLFQKDYKVDSSAYDYDSAYWAKTRPMPLNENEIEGYEWLDSLANEQEKQAEGDTATSQDKDRFSPVHFITGGRYDIGEKAHFSLSRIKPNFNTVEGWNLEYDLNFTKTFENKNWLKIAPTFRYGFASNEFYSKLGVAYGYGSKLKRGNIKLEGGKYVYQFNRSKPIHPIINTFSTLLFRENFMKIYENRFVQFDFSKKLQSNWKIGAGVSYNERIQLTNSTDNSLIDIDNKQYSSNAPENLELVDTTFPSHEALLVDAFIEYKPGLKLMARNNRFMEVDNSAPVFNLKYRSGLEPVFGDVGFHHLNFNVQHTFILLRNDLKTELNTGTFFGDNPRHFPDYQHFMGNETPLLPDHNFGKYRLLDYYLFSTSQEYLNAHAEYQPAKFLLSQFKKIRFSGLRESVYVNYLLTTKSNQYFEVGFAVDNIFRLIRLEAVTSFQDGQYKDFGIMIGLASFINFTENGIQFDF